MSWEAVSGISSIVGTAVVIVAAWIGLRQVAEALASRELQGVVTIIQQFQSAPIGEVRTFLRSRNPEIAKILTRKDGLTALDSYLRNDGGGESAPDSLAELREHLSVLEFVSFLSLSGRIPRELELAYLAPTIPGYWHAAAPFVLAIRRDRGSDVYLQHLEAFARLIESGGVFHRRAARLKRHEMKALVRRSRSSIAKGSAA